MNLFKKLGFRKLDEKGAQRQLYIVNAAVKISWIFYTFALLIWLAVEVIQNGQTSVFSILMIIVPAGQTILWGSYLYYNKKKKTLVEL